MKCALTSFAFRKGVPHDANMLFDVRFLRNPFYDTALSAKSGRDAGVGDYIEADPAFADFYARLTALLLPLLPRYAQAKQDTFHLAIGCTGGQHRSVYVVEKLGGFLESKGYSITITHRDLE